MNERRPSLEEAFLADLKRLLTDDSFGARTTMLATFEAKKDTGGPGGSDLAAGKVIPIREGVLVHLWPRGANSGDRAAFTAHMVSEPPDAWADVPQPASVEVRGRLEKGGALVIDLDGGRLRSLHPTTVRRFRAARLAL